MLSIDKYIGLYCCNGLFIFWHDLIKLKYPWQSNCTDMVFPKLPAWFEGYCAFGDLIGASFSSCHSQNGVYFLITET